MPNVCAHALTVCPVCLFYAIFFILYETQQTQQRQKNSIYILQAQTDTRTRFSARLFANAGGELCVGACDNAHVCVGNAHIMNFMYVVCVIFINASGQTE